MDGLPHCRQTGWEDIERWSARVAEQIREKDRVPDTIVALTRGGWVPARIFADLLGVRRLLALRAQHWGVTATPSGTAELTEPLQGEIRGEKVLLVDDITDTGESLRLAERHVADRGTSRLESATLLHIDHSKYVPTYYGETIPRGDWVWVVFPWNYWEDLRTLAAKAVPDGKDAAGVRRILRRDCGLDVPVKDILRAVPSLSPARPRASSPRGPRRRGSGRTGRGAPRRR